MIMISSQSDVITGTPKLRVVAPKTSQHVFRTFVLSLELRELETIGQGSLKWVYWQYGSVCYYSHEISLA
jgi:hypothetical protein